jgi:arginyl-tRNA synthetase
LPFIFNYQGRYNLMQHLKEKLVKGTVEALNINFGFIPSLDTNSIQLTKKEFAGQLTIVVFPFTRQARKSPEVIAQTIGEYLKKEIEEVEDYNVVKGFLNLNISDSYWVKLFQGILSNEQFGKHASTGKKYVVEYCGPNTNKPLHLGHIRNMLIGYSISNILSAAGHEVHKVNIYNDRGIAICKSMLAWQKFGNGETPDSTGMKGDHFVGKYYVLFATKVNEEINQLMAGGMSKEQAAYEAPLQKEAREMLLKWEQGDKETLALWNKMNQWVYTGFEETYQKLGVDFEKAYYESEHYESGKKMVEDGLKKGIFYKKADGSVWVDLTDEGMDEKILLRADGTSVYLTQDIGTAESRYNDYKMDKSVYVVANEQDYHFKALKAALKKLKKPYGEGIYHLSYGMVDLPTGKMKSREGTTVDADDLYDEMLDTAEEHTVELGKIDGFSAAEAKELYRKLGMGALKYFLLKVHPKKKMLFNPQESIEFQGDTGPFIQYTNARISSILRKWQANHSFEGSFPAHINEQELELIMHISRYPETIQFSAGEFDPSQIATYVYALAKLYNKFYVENPILSIEDESLQYFRIILSEMTARTIQSSMGLLGIEVPERM